jgi:CheY-like chemotaxis protein
MEGQRRRILVIDDEIRFGSVIARVLEAECDVIVVASAEEAIDRVARRERFDLFFCDLKMPGMAGPDFRHNLGVLAAELVERVVFITAGATTLEALAFLEQSNVHWIEKPFPSLATFRAAVRRHLVRVRGGMPSGGGAP